MDIQARTDFAQTMGLNLDQYQKLVTSCTYDEMITCCELLKAKKPKSQYRAKLALHIRLWLDGGPSLKPLTMYEFRNAAPRWPVKYTLPR